VFSCENTWLGMLRVKNPERFGRRWLTGVSLGISELSFFSLLFASILILANVQVSVNSVWIPCFDLWLDSNLFCS